MDVATITAEGEEPVSTEPAPTEPVPLEPAAPPAPYDPTIRRLYSILFLLLFAFLIVRTLCVEPFGVTTGSMAETILGNRRCAACPRCGAENCAGSPDDAKSNFNPQEYAACWNCNFAPLNLASLAPGEIQGDRLLVDKLVYSIRAPKRWEVAVFHCPVDDRKPYVKRVVGLPGETFRLWEGDAYANGEILRKSMDQIRETRIPFFSHDEAPAEGWSSRWEIGPAAGREKLPATKAKLPDVAAVIQPKALVLDARNEAFGLTYVHRDLESEKPDFVRDRLGYNGGGRRREWLPVHDFCVSAEIEVGSGEGSLAMRLSDGADSAIVELPIGFGTAGSMAREGGDPVPLHSKATLKPGSTVRIEFAFVDRRIHLAIDNRELAVPIDVPKVPRKIGGTGPAGLRPGLMRPFQFGVRGASVVVRRLVLYRDIHYRTDDDDCSNATRSDLKLAVDEYFVLGDNSASSSDSRVWSTPGVPESFFLGKPFLIHQPLKQGNLPFLGRVQTIDWNRLRLLD